MLCECWEALGGSPDRVSSLEVTDAGAWLGGPLDVDGLALGAAGSVLLAAAELAEARGFGRPAASVSASHLALSFTSERHLLVRGEPAGAGFAPLSRMVRCAGGGWARTHANYPHHAAALRRALSLRADTVEALEAAAGELRAEALEDAVMAAGGCAVALRTAEEWAAHPAGAAVARAPLVEWVESAPAALATPPAAAWPTPAPGASRQPAARPATSPGASRQAAARPAPGPSAARPAAGLRVLDLTRVIAGPVAGRTLAALGAEVLRIDPPGLPELPEAHLDTGPGKRSALLDLADGERREALLAGADVLLTGYRPGALDRFGLDRRPHLVHVSLSAWGPSGAWAQRRGFDSLVQVATGIAAACAAPDGTPGVLPAQALDHGTGHLMAAAALRGLAARARGEAPRSARLSLARAAAALLAAPRRDAAARAADPVRHRVAFGDVELIAPPGALDGVPLAWAHGPRPLGGDPPAWPPRAVRSSG
jgi:crotonobetainyl-CoA:carnitine CoA-transferase CaiB-like acyl-CoA transferase